MDIKKTLEQTEKFEGEWNGEKFEFHAYTHALTPEFRKLWQEAESDPEKDAELLSRMIARWDLTLGDDPFPPVKDNLLILPTKFLGYLFTTILESYSGNAPTPSE